MGVYIKGMEMPENCALCPMWDAGDCLTASEAIICEYDKRPQDCPLVPVPPHGWLIDQDAYRDEFMDGVYALCNDDPDNYRANAIIDLYDNAPTIIPAEGGET